MATLTASTFSTDQEKYLAAQLIKRSLLRLVASSVCDYHQMPEGAGLTPHFIRYNRMNVPVAVISEGVDPSDNSLSVSEVTGTLDQWGDVLTISDVSQLTTKHPLVQQCLEALSESAARIIDREIQVVWLSGTNVQYFDGTVTARASLSSANKISDTVIHKARVTMTDAGVGPRGGPSGGIFVEGGLQPGMSGMKGIGGAAEESGSINQRNAYVAFCGPQVLADIAATSTSIGTWVSAQAYANSQKLYTFEVGTWLGIRFVETNFIPKFQRLGDNTAAVTTGNSFGTNTPVVSVAAGGAGTLSQATTYYFKVTAKDLQRGFEEYIALEHSMATTGAGGATQYYTFNFGAVSSSFVYNLYFGSATGDANLKLVQANITSGTTVTVNAVPSSTTTAPANTANAVTIHPVFIFGADAIKWVGLQSFQFYITGDKATTDNPLVLRKKMGFKFMGKSIIMDQNRLLRIEVASTY